MITEPVPVSPQDTPKPRRSRLSARPLNHLFSLTRQWWKIAGGFRDRHAATTAGGDSRRLTGCRRLGGGAIGPGLSGRMAGSCASGCNFWPGALVAIRRSDHPQRLRLVRGQRSRSALYVRRRLGCLPAADANRTGYLVWPRVQCLTGAAVHRRAPRLDRDRVQARPLPSRPMGAPHVAVAGAARRAARARSSQTAAVAAIRAAATAIKVICQLVMPPAVTTAGGRRLIWRVVGDIVHRCPCGRHDGRRGQQGAGDRGQGCGEPAQARGSRSRGAARMRFPAGKVCGHDRLLPVRNWPGVRPHRQVRAGRRRAGQGPDYPFPAAARPGVGLPTRPGRACWPAAGSRPARR